MYLVQIGKPFLTEEGLDLKGRPVGVVQGVVVISEREEQRLVSAAEIIWEGVISRCRHAEKFLGLARFDLVPDSGSLYRTAQETQKHLELGLREFDLGELCVKGIYEVNLHSPEGVAAASALHANFPDLSRVQPSSAESLARVLRRTFPGKKIHVVIGSSLIKDAWGQVFMDDLQRLGLNLCQVSVEEAMDLNPPILWRWGDARFRGYSEYPPEFTRWMGEYEGVVFNTMLFE